MARRVIGKRVRVLLDEEDYFRFKNKKLLAHKDGRVYFNKNNQVVYLHRAIFNLTDPKDRVLFKTSNRLDMRKKNLMINSMPKKARGRYAVHLLDQ